MNADKGPILSSDLVAAMQAATLLHDYKAAHNSAQQQNGSGHARVQWDPAVLQAPPQQPDPTHGYVVPTVIPVNSLQHTNSLQHRKSGIPDP